MHGTGNDYVYINGFVENIKNPSELSLKLSDRHKGVGSDGLVVILPSEDCDFKMRLPSGRICALAFRVSMAI